MDERVQGEYRKIYSELLSLVMTVTAVSLLVKFLYFDYGLKECATEFIILIGGSLYLTVRQCMLGLGPEDSMPKEKRRKRMLVSFIGTLCGYAFAYAVKSGEVSGHLWTDLLCFAAVYVFVYFLSGRLSSLFSVRREKKYGD